MINKLADFGFDLTPDQLNGALEVITEAYYPEHDHTRENNSIFWTNLTFRIKDIFTSSQTLIPIALLLVYGNIEDKRQGLLEKKPGLLAAFYFPLPYLVVPSVSAIQHDLAAQKEIDEHFAIYDHRVTSAPEWKPPTETAPADPREWADIDDAHSDPDNYVEYDERTLTEKVVHQLANKITGADDNIATLTK